MKQESLFKFFQASVKISDTKREESVVSSKKENDDPQLEGMEQFMSCPRRSRLRKAVVDSDEEFKVKAEMEKMEEEEDAGDMVPTTSEQKPMSGIKKSRASQKQRKEENIDPTNLIQEKKETQEVIRDFDDSTPSWAKPGQSKDKQLRLHGTEEADPSTLFIPPYELKMQTKAMQQYWAIKQDNFDKVIFFKLGKFYELFYEDALVGHRHLELNWMGRKMHTGFPEKCLQKYAKLLIDKGFKVAVVDQTETPDQMQKRITENKKSGVGQTEKVVFRELTQVLTKGTIQEDENDDNRIEGDERILMCIKKNIISSMEEQYGIVMLESQTNVISLAKITNEDMSYQHLKTLLLQCRPIEVIVDPSNIPNYDPIIKILQGQAINSQLSYLRKKADNWDGRKTVQYFTNKLPQGIAYFQQDALVLDALTGLMSYLDTILIKDKVLDSARFKVYDAEASKLSYMMLDNQALYHLEILSSSVSGQKGSDYSLFGCIDRTITAGGRRMLRRWVCAPLFSRHRIVDRQDAVDDLLHYRSERDTFRKALKGLPDLERLCARTYSYSIDKNTKAIYYEDFSLQRLKEFKELCKKLRYIDSELDKLSKLSHLVKSQRLRNLLTRVAEVPETQEGHIYQLEDDSQTALLPQILLHLDAFENYIVWQGQTPMPIPGILSEYDEANNEVDTLKKQFEEYLTIIRKRLNDSQIQYAHAKYRYELEVPAKLVEKHKPDDFEFTSAKQGFQRFHTQRLKDMVYNLERAEEEQKKQLTFFVQYVFKHFHQNYRVWDRYISVISELDALISLSIWGQVADGIMCRPVIREPSDKPYLAVEEARHPCLALTGLNFVPNNISLGGDDPRFLLLTGPNMGGKSTTLRMVCVLAILAQVGAMVPCKSMELSLIDRIFTRLGAKDQLMEGKSTFYIELEETLVPLKYATKDSLFITDELGRGTSTFDGVAIAYSVMKYLVERIKCRVLFATHFRILVEEANLLKDIQNVHMVSLLNNIQACYVEEAQEKVVFLYKLKPGACPASFGINVARVTGIPNSVLEKAKQKAATFEQSVGIHSYQQKLKDFSEALGHAINDQ